MNIGVIFTKERYGEAYDFVVANPNTTIKDLGKGLYQVIEIPAPTTEELSVQKRAERNAILDATDKFTSIPDYPITNEKREKYKKYRQYLRDIPQQDDFPNIEILNFEDWLLTQENN